MNNKVQAVWQEVYDRYLDKENDTEHFRTLAEVRSTLVSHCAGCENWVSGVGGGCIEAFGGCNSCLKEHREAATDVIASKDASCPIGLWQKENRTEQPSDSDSTQ